MSTLRRLEWSVLKFKICRRGRIVRARGENFNRRTNLDHRPDRWDHKLCEKVWIRLHLGGFGRRSWSENRFSVQPYVEPALLGETRPRCLPERGQNRDKQGDRHETMLVCSRDISGYCSSFFSQIPGASSSALDQVSWTPCDGISGTDTRLCRQRFEWFWFENLVNLKWNSRSDRRLQYRRFKTLGHRGGSSHCSGSWRCGHRC